MTRTVEAASVVGGEKSFSKKWSPASSPGEPLPEEISFDSLKTVLPALVNGQNGEAGDDVMVEQTQEFVLGKNIHGTCLEITEPEVDDEVTGDRDAYMAGILARYRKTLVEKTKYHLGAHAILYTSPCFCDFLSWRDQGMITLERLSDIASMMVF